MNCRIHRGQSDGGAIKRASCNYAVSRRLPSKMLAEATVCTSGPWRKRVIQMVDNGPLTDSYIRTRPKIALFTVTGSSSLSTLHFVLAHELEEASE